METEKSTTEQIIEKAKESEAAGASAFMNPEPKKAKGKPGRPKGSASVSSSAKSRETGADSKTDGKKEEKPQFEIPTKVLCYPIVKGISVGGVYYTNNPRAAMTPDEAEAMAQALGMVLDKYMPDAMKNFGPEMALAFSLGQYGIRLYAIKKVMEAEQAKKAPSHNPEAPRPQSEHVQNNLVADEQSFTVI